MSRKCGNEERFTNHFLIFSFYPSLPISYIKNCHILSSNVKSGTFVANVTKNLTYALWENNSVSNALRQSSASCAGLDMRWISGWCLSLCGWSKNCKVHQEVVFTFSQLIIACQSMAPFAKISDATIAASPEQTNPKSQHQSTVKMLLTSCP